MCNANALSEVVFCNGDIVNISWGHMGGGVLRLLDRLMRLRSGPSVAPLVQRQQWRWRHWQSAAAAHFCTHGSARCQTTISGGTVCGHSCKTTTVVVVSVAAAARV